MLEKKQNVAQRGFVTWIVFLLTLSMALLHLISAIFPNLFLTSVEGFDDHLGINQFEIGLWSYQIVIINVIIFGILLLYLKNKMPDFLKSLVQYVFNFEVSRTVAFFVVTILIGAYIIFSVGELFDGYFQADYYERVQEWLENYSFTKIDTEKFDSPGLGNHVLLLFGTISIQVFENVKVIPFLSSISLVVLTYFVTVKIAEKRFAGIVALIILLQSGVFLMYDTSISYPTFWISLYLLSLYLIYKKWPISPIAYIVSIFTKALTAAFLPMTLFFIYRAKIPKQNKIRLLAIYCGIIILAISALFVTDSTDIWGKIEFSYQDFLAGFNAVHTSLRLDGLVLSFLLPLVVGLFVTSSRGFKQADAIMFLIFGMLLSAPLIPAFADLINVPYRFIPLVVFFAIGVGVLLSKKSIE